MSELQQLHARFEELGAQAKSILDKEAPTEEELTRVEEIQKEQEEIKGKIEAAKKTADRARQLKEANAANQKWLNKPLRGGDGADEAESLPFPAKKGMFPAIRTKGSNEGFGDFLRCVYGACCGKSSKAVDRLGKAYGSEVNDWGDERKDLMTTTGPGGGYTVPPQYYAELLQYTAEAAIMRPGATMIPMGGPQVSIPVLDQTTAPTAGNTSFFGGVAATWLGEGAPIPETDPKFRQTSVKAHKLAGLTEVTRELLDDSAFGIESLLYTLFGRAVAWYEDYAFLRGDGVGQPLGVLNSPALLKTAARTGAATITLSDITNMYSIMLPEAMRRGVWVTSVPALPKIFQMTGAANSVFIPNGFVAGSGGAVQNMPNLQLLGNPLIVTEKLPGLNTVGDLLFLDRQSYLIGDRGTLEIAASEHYRFGHHMIVFRFIHRVAGQPWVNSPLTLADATTRVSPFIALEIGS